MVRKNLLVAIASILAISSTFSLSFQSSFHLSLTVLVRYRSLAGYLALDEIYHPLRAAIPNNSTRGMCPVRGELVSRLSTGFSPSLIPYSKGLKPGSPLVSSKEEKKLVISKQRPVRALSQDTKPPTHL